jgi:pimeloyl-ACP methyl ester carboxylesterase
LAKDFHIFRLDLPGHGRSPLAGLVPDFEGYARLIAHFSQSHNLERAVLLGHSMGGILSLLAAGSGQLAPRAVINLDGSLSVTERTLAAQKLICGWVRGPDFRQRLARQLRSAFFLPSERDARCEAIIHTMCSAPAAVLSLLPGEVAAVQSSHILSKVKVPVLYVGSATPRFDAPKALSAIPHLKLEQIADTGHFLHIYAADRVAFMIRRFLATAISST